MGNKKIRVVAYARVSTKKDEQKNSLENQRRYFKRELEKDKKYTLVSLPTNDNGIYVDKGYSGTKLSRPAFDKMLLDAGLRKSIDEKTGKPVGNNSYRIEYPPKFDAIFVKDTSRFARNVSINDILQQLKNNGVIVHFLDLGKTTANSSDMTYIQLFFVLAEQESRNRSEKVKFGYAEGVRKGRVYAGSIPLGYDYIPLNADNPLEGNRLVANDKAIIIKTIFNLYEQGYGSRHIEERLEHLGYTTANGGKIDRSVIRYILQNSKYTGENNAGRFTHGDLFNKKLAPVPYDDETRKAGRKASAEIAQKLAEKGKVQIEPIIDKAQFLRIQERFSQQSNRFKKKEAYNSYNPYHKKIRCAFCGAFCLVSYSVPLTDKNNNPVIDENGERIMKRRFLCSNRHQRGKGVCPAHSFDQQVIDSLLDSSVYYEAELQMIEELQGACEACIITLNEAINKDNKEAVSTLDAKISILTEERSRLLSLFAKGVYDEAELERLTKDYTKQIDELTAKRKQLSKTNDEIQADIDLVKGYMLTAAEEEKTIKRILKNKKYDDIDRKEKLKNIDYVSIDPFGEPTIVFKAYTDMQKVIDYIDNISNMYYK